MKKVRIDVVAIFIALSANSASAEFKTFKQLDQEYVATHTPEERLEHIKSYVEHYGPFAEMGEQERSSSFLMAAAKVAPESCLTTSVVDGKPQETLPKWVINEAYLFDPPSFEFTSEADHPKNILAWTIVALMRDDPKPCDLAEAVFKSLHK